MAPPTDRRADFAPDASSLAAAVALALSATTVILAQFDDRPGDDYQVHTLLFASDIPLLVLALVGARRLPAAVRAWRSHPCALAGLALGACLLPALVVHPTDRGVAALLRLAGAVGLALSIGSARGDGRRLLLGTAAAVTLAHVVVGFAERANGGPVGLGSLGEPTAYVIGGRYASTGLTVHPYVLAAWCAVAGTALLALVRRRLGPGRLASVAGAVAFGGLGLTMSRAGAVGAVLGLGALAAWSLRRSERAWRLTVLSAGAALAFGVLVNLSGWVSRASQDTGSVESLSTGRGALVRQAWPLFEDHPVAGVGPGRYVLALMERPELVELSAQTPRPVHVTPLLLLVEGGLLVVPGLALLAVAVGWACRRGGAAAVAVTLVMLPFLALDHLVWSYPQGLVLAGLWLGVLDLLGQPNEEERPHEEPSC